MDPYRQCRGNMVIIMIKTLRIPKPQAGRTHPYTTGWRIMTSKDFGVRILLWVPTGLILGFFIGGLSIVLAPSYAALGPVTFLYRLLAESEYGNVGYARLATGQAESRYDGSAVKPVTIGDGRYPNVALMFNLDWGQDIVPRILDVLEEHDVKCTFFVTGTFARKNSELILEIARRGHEVATHGEEHKNSTSLRPRQLDRLILKGAKILEEITGKTPPPLFSPPSGDWNSAVVERASRLGFQTILWTINTADWQLPPPEVIAKRALAGCRNGALILLHPTEPTLKALPTIITEFKSRGFTLTTVTRTLGDHE
ncbi:MAG TPA: polysaccharide deacetylase family protein [Clostridia bacterium]|nr:polysaccharide deacetylase family protein [Clostridia bacterium]